MASLPTRISVIIAAGGIVFLSLLSTACSGTVDTNKDGGNTDGGGPILCSGDAECPSTAPVCSGGICTEGGAGCTSPSDCPSGVCNALTGQCDACTDCCVADTDCSGGQTCQTGHCAAPNSPCTTVAECAVDQICTAGNCAAWDPNEPCAVNEDCPIDHQCNSLGDARCEGCLNDAFCASSANGPKCDILDDGVGPGVGYCHPECGGGLPDCPATFTCDASRGGLCVPACQTNADCQGGQVCKGINCEACASDAQCDPGKVCSSGSCVDNPGCTDTQCSSSLGAAYFCDQTTTSCRLGCTATGCTGDVSACNPCPSGQTCDALSHSCSGGVCSAGCSPPCAGGMTCDFVSCTCTTQGGGGGNGGPGASCLTNAECQAGLICNGALPDFGIPGSCGEGCDMNTFCVCADPAKTCTILGDPTTDVLLCLLGTAGTCQ